MRLVSDIDDFTTAEISTSLLYLYKILYICTYAN